MKILPKSLINVGWRYLLRRPWQTILMLLGITLGVAVLVAVDLANASASRAFDLSVNAVAGRATHQIVGGPQGLDEQVYVRLRREGITRLAAPLVSEYVASPQLGGQTLQLLGIDPLAEPPFRNYFAPADDAPLNTLLNFITQPGALLISADLAQRYDLAPGTPISLEIAGYERQAFIAGLLEPRQASSRQALSGLALADVATAQELSGRLGKLDRIDLIIAQDDDAQLERIRAWLPADARLLPAETRSGSLEQMTAAFRLNLTALSLLALFVGMFLIYNTMTFSVVQRRPLFGRLRCLGVTRRELFALVVGEAFAVGLLGSALGLGLGVLMGRSAVRLVSQTINDLYFVLTVQSVGVAASSLIKGGILGLGATLVAAGLPAWEAASAPPRVALSRSGLESKAQHRVLQAAVGGCLLLLAGGGALALPTRSLLVGFGGATAVMMGFALLTPITTRLLMHGAAPLLGRVWGTLGRMAPRDVVSSFSRTSVAVAALMVAMGVSIGVSLMIGSFRHTVVVWLDHALQADVYISASSLAGAQSPTPINPAALPLIERTAGVQRVEKLRVIMLDSPDGPIHIQAGNGPEYGYNLIYRAVEGSPQAAWDAVQQGALIVSEPLANRLNLPQHGGEIMLYTPQGPHSFPVSGIYYDYASSQGKAIMSLNIYRQLWNDDTVTALAVLLNPNANPDQVTQDLQQKLSPLQRLVVSPNRALRQEALTIFDRTFAITGALQLLSTAVAFIGVLSALLSLLLEKQRQLGILRSMGLTVRELYGLIMLETGLIGAVAGLLAMPAGLTLALILVYIINQRSFGWTLLMQVQPGPFVQALAVAVLAALLAGLYPAYRMGKMLTVEALRYE